MTTSILTTTPDCEIISTRVFNFSQEILFEAWASPNHLKNWWGPAGFTNTFHEFDFKIGGKWRFTMHGPDKGNYENECDFIKIEKPSIIAWQRISKPIFQVIALFEDINQHQTKLVFKMLFNSVEECQKLKPYVIDKNEENFDKLEIELFKISL